MSKKMWSLSFPKGIQTVLSASSGCARMLAGVRSHPGPIMFLSGDLPKGVMSAWSSQAGFVEKVGPKSPCWFKTLHLQICSQIAWVSSKEWFAWFANSTLLSWEFILGIKEPKCLVKSFILSKVKSYWKENREMCEMLNQKKSTEKVFEDLWPAQHRGPREDWELVGFPFGPECWCPSGLRCLWHCFLSAGIFNLETTDPPVGPSIQGVCQLG